MGTKTVGQDFTRALAYGGVLVAVFFISGYVLTGGRGLEDPVYVQRFIIYGLLGLFGLVGV